MKNLITFVIIGAVVTAVLAVIFIVLLRNPAEPSSDIIVFASGEATDLRSVAVSNQYGDFYFHFDAEEGGYVTDDIPAYLVDVDVFVEFMARSSQLAALRAIAPGAYELHETGFDNPSASVQIEFFDGSIFDLTIGVMERVSGNYYALVSGTGIESTMDRDYIYIIPQSLAQQFLLPKTQVITRYLTPQLMLSSPLSAIRDISFAGSALSQPVLIRSVTGDDNETALAAKSFGTATHIVYGGSHYQLDQSYGIEVLGSLFGIRGDIAGYDLNDEDFAALGFDTPYMIIQYDMVNDMTGDSIPMLLRIAPAEDGRFYATINDICAVFVIDHKPFIDIQFERLPLRWFLTPMLMDLSAILVSTPNGSHHFEIDNTNSRDPVITYEGQELDTTLFRTFFRLITSASHDGTYLGALPHPAGDPLLRISYVYSLPEKNNDILELYPGETRRVNVYVNGAGEFAMRDLFAQRVAEGLENLLLGLPIEEQW